MLFYAPSAPHLVYAAPSPSPIPSPFHAYAPPTPRTCRQEHSDVLSSRERYVRAQAEMRAAEAEYAASVTHAREEARLREQQRTQRALQDEILVARALQIQAERVRRQQAIEAERQRAELMRRRLLWDATVRGDLDGEDLSWVEPRRRVVRYPFAASRAREAVRPDLEESPLAGLDDILQILHAAGQRQQAPIADPRPPTVPTQPPTASAPLPAPQSKHDAKGKGKARDPSPGADPSLKSRLEERLAHGSSDAEIEETVRSLIASLFGEDARSAPAPASAAGEPSSSKVKLAPDARATRAAPADHPTPTSAPAATSSPASRAPTPTLTSGLDAVTAIESSFRALQHDFAFPSTLDFDAPPAPPTASPASPTTSASSASSASADAAQDYVLAYTPANAPVRAYEHALSELLARLDAVESDGNEAVRGRRRSVVRDVERALDEVDRLVGERKAGRAGRRAVRADADADAEEHAVESAVTIGERGRVDLVVSEAVSADAARAVQHAPTPTPSPLHDGAGVFVEVGPTVASSPDVEAATELSATSESSDVLAPAAVGPASVETPEAVPQDDQLSALASSTETVQAKPTDSGSLTPDSDIVHAPSSEVSQPPSSPSEATESKLDTTEPPAPAPSTRPSPPTPSPPTPSDAAEDYLSSLSHAQFTFPPRRDLSAEEPEDAVLVESDAERSSVDSTSESGSERDAWSEVEA